MEKINILSPAKINLSLDIISKRDDGFHNIRSCVQIIDFFDEISIEINNNDSSISLDCSEKKISSKENLAFIAANKFFEAFNVRSGLKIKIKKRIPLGAGMGGGSSNAAAVLIGLSKMFKIEDGYCAGFFEDFNGNKNYTNLPRQAFPKAYHPNGYIDIAKRDYVMNQKDAFGMRIMPVITPHTNEIDTKSDIKAIQFQISTIPARKNELFKYMNSKWSKML